MYQIKNKYITSNLTVSKSIEIANNKKIKNLKYKYKEYNKKKNFKNKTNSTIKYIKIKQYSCKYFKQLYTNLNSTQNKLIKVYIKVTLNNIFITYLFNNKIYTKSIASLGFKGKSKQTSYAYKTFAEFLVTELQNFAEQTFLQINLLLLIYILNL